MEPLELWDGLWGQRVGCGCLEFCHVLCSIPWSRSHSVSLSTLRPLLGTDSREPCLRAREEYSEGLSESGGQEEIDKTQQPCLQKHKDPPGSWAVSCEGQKGPLL